MGSKRARNTDLGIPTGQGIIWERPFLRPQGPPLDPFWPCGLPWQVQVRASTGVGPKTQRWEPGAWPSKLEVPSRICATLGSKWPFFAQNSLEPHKKWPNDGKRSACATMGLVYLCQRAFHWPYARETPQTSPKMPKNPCNLAPKSQTEEWVISWAMWLKTQL